MQRKPLLSWIALHNHVRKFRQDHGFLPGVVPEAILAGSPQISGTENALLHLMGGYVVEDEIGATAYGQYSTDDGWREVSFDDNSDDGSYKIRVNLQRIGEGPTIKGRKFSPYFSPSEREMLDIEMTGSEQYSPGFGSVVSFARSRRRLGPPHSLFPTDTYTWRSHE